MTSVMKRVSTGRHGGLITMKSLVIREWSLPMATAMDSSTARLRVLGFSCVSESVVESVFVEPGHLAPAISPATTDSGQNLRSSRWRPVFEGRAGGACGVAGVSADGNSFSQLQRGSLIARTITAIASSATAIELRGGPLLFMSSRGIDARTSSQSAHGG